MTDQRKLPGELLLRHKDGDTPVRTAPVFLGREADNDVILGSTKASRHHAAVYRLGSSFVLRDLHSKNGITLNGEEVKSATLSDGDRLRLAGEKVDVMRSTASVEDYAPAALILEANVIGYSELHGRYGSAFERRIAELFQRLEDQVLLARGCPIKDRGDGLKAAFGIWILEDRRYSAADAALNFAKLARDEVQRDIFEFSKEVDSCDLRIGLACGDVDYSQEDGFDVVGWPAQLAAQVAELNRSYGTNILMCQRCRDVLRVIDHVREIDTVKSAATGQTTLFGFDDRSHIRQVASTAVTDEQSLLAPLKYLEMYAQALELYRRGDLNAAFKLFGETYKAYRDRPARSMRDRISGLAERAGQEGWDGVWDLDRHSDTKHHEEA